MNFRQSLPYMLGFYALVFLLIWAAGPPIKIHLITGDDCSQIVNRVFHRPGRTPIGWAEKRDLVKCGVR